MKKKMLKARAGGELTYTGGKIRIILTSPKPHK